FFQAEDGIRDFHVTGVQTCALPILVAAVQRGLDGQRIAHPEGEPRPWRDVHAARAPDPGAERRAPAATQLRRPLAEEREQRERRSEERRVGKEWRGRWASEH